MPTAALPLFNQQPIERQELSADGSLEIVKIWHTVQGEGPFAGRPAVFIRLAGCDMQCPRCDTDYTTGRHRMTVPEIAAEVDRVSRGSVCNLAVITGGEPFRQSIGQLCRDLSCVKWQVQVETNGTLALEDFPYVGVHLICSPKAGAVNSRIRNWVRAYKYVARHGELDPDDGLPMTALGGVKPARPDAVFPRHMIFLQPLDEGDEALNRLNLRAAAVSCMRHGYTLGTQLHKHAGLE